MQRRLLDAGAEPLTLTGCMYTAGAAFVLSACIGGFALRPSLLTTPGMIALDAKGGLALAYATVLSSALSYALIGWASARLEPSTISLWTSGQGVFTLLLALLILGSWPSAMQLVGGLLISLGLLVCVGESVHEAPGEQRAHLLSAMYRAEPSQRSDSASGVHNVHGSTQYERRDGPCVPACSPAPSPPYTPPH